VSKIAKKPRRNSGSELSLGTVKLFIDDE